MNWILTNRSIYLKMLQKNWNKTTTINCKKKHFSNLNKME